MVVEGYLGPRIWRMHRGYIPTSGEKLHPQNLQMMGLLMIRIHRLVENVPPVRPIALGGDYNSRCGLRMADKADAPGVHPYQRGKVAPTKFAHDGIVDETNSPACRDVPPVHPIALGGDFNGGRRLFRMADKADAPGVHPYQRGKVAPTKFAHDGIVDETNSSARSDTHTFGDFFEGWIKKCSLFLNRLHPLCLFISTVTRIFSLLIFHRIQIHTEGTNTQFFRTQRSTTGRIFRIPTTTFNITTIRVTLRCTCTRRVLSRSLIFGL